MDIFCAHMNPRIGKKLLSRFADTRTVYHLEKRMTNGR